MNPRHHHVLSASLLRCALTLVLLACNDGPSSGFWPGFTPNGGTTSPTTGGPGNPTVGGGSTTGSGLGQGPTGGEPDRPSAGCTSRTSHPATGRITLQVGSAQRAFDLHAGGGSGTPRPLVLALHGYTMNASEHARITRLSELADQEGFVVAYPDGLGIPTSWNAGSCCAYDEPNRDDMGFMAAIIDDLSERLCLDLSRVYATGFSNGGMMSYRLGCQMSDRIAAFASVSGSAVIPLQSCRPQHPMPMIHVHGTADPIVAFAGGSGPQWLTPLGEIPPEFPSAQSEVDRFATLNGCSATTETFFNATDATCVERTGCNGGAEVALCTAQLGGHTWPGGAPMGTGLAGPVLALVLGAQSASLPATQLIWDFLKTHRLP